jgi:choline dehydrogenase-like flavoprotein
MMHLCPLTPLFLLAGFLQALAAATQTTITSDPSVASNHQFDYIVAGGGLSGLVVANKLSGRGHRVLVVEAGPDAKNEISILNAALINNLAPGICNWNYTASFDNGTAIPTKVSSGRCLGGSTSINGKVWFLPAPAELDALTSLGSPGWNFATLFPLILATETFIPPTDTQIAQGAAFVASDHGTSGPVNVSFPTPMRIPTAQALYKAAMPIAFPGLVASQDLSKRTDGGSVMASTVWSLWFDAVAGFNKRSSAAFAFLYPASQQRPTLTILTGHKVTKVLFNSYIKATGIQFTNSASGGTIYTASVAKEVLLAGGTLQTPALLERSGIGAQRILKKFNIKQLVDLPGVGANLIDQPGTAVSALLNAANASNPLLDDNVNIFGPIISLVNINQLFGNRSAIEKQKLINGNPKRATAAVATGGAATLEGASKLFSTQTALIVEGKMPVGEVIGEAFPFVMSSIFWPSLPFSRGHVHIGSADPLADPVITPRFFTDQFDLDAGVQLAKQSRVMFQSTPFSSVIANPFIDAVPANGTDADWENFLRSTSFGASHWVGTSALLPRHDGGVVSPSLKVYGTSGLRVIDASILPLELSSHLQPVIYGIAQRAAQLILADA